jgi:O-antigen ligase
VKAQPGSIPPANPEHHIWRRFVGRAWSPVTVLQQSTLERLFVFFLAVSVFVSKSGIYAATVFLFVYFLARLVTSREYRAFFRSKKLAIASVALYLLGLAVTVAYPGHIEDVSVYARKGAFLLLIPPLMFAFRDPTTRRIALLGLVFGFWVDFTYTFYRLDWVWSGGHVDGTTWRYDQWSVMLALFFSFLVPITFGMRWTLAKAFLVATLFAVVLALLMGGGRGPWLGALFALALYLSLQQRRAVLYLIVFFLLAYIPLQALFGEQVKYVGDRVQSITDLEENISNRWRMEYWDISIRYIYHMMKTDQKTFLLGSGPVHQEARITDFIEATGVKEEGRYVFIRDRSQWRVTNAHNMYLECLGKMGLIWTTLVLAFLLVLVRSGWVSSVPVFSAWSALTVVVAFLVMGVFATILAQFASFTLVFLMTLALGARTLQADRGKQEVADCEGSAVVNLASGAGEKSVSV